MQAVHGLYSEKFDLFASDTKQALEETSATDKYREIIFINGMGPMWGIRKRNNIIITNSVPNSFLKMGTVRESKVFTKEDTKGLISRKMFLMTLNFVFFLTVHMISFYEI